MNRNCNESNAITQTNIIIAKTDGTKIFDSKNVVSKTIGKTTYIANLHFKEQGQTFTQKFKRVLKAESGS